ncbi:MAG TPA: phosphotransferase family protein [Longimicrobiaceae bacterium]|nr:phosphotransferase family protein [Longimicrobiaceae bacterium]
MPHPETTATIPVREGEDFDRERLLAYLREHLPEIPAGPLEVRQFPTGASNLTYLLRVGEWEGVLRRPPLGPVPPRAHDMEREGELLRRLHRVYPLAPRPFLVCTDPEVLGSAFSVMEHRRGVVVDARLPEGVAPTAETGRAVADAVVGTLVELHRVDYRAAGLEDLGRPEGFLERQVEGWTGRYQKARTDEVPGADALMAWLRGSVPASPAATVIHNDFKLNNLLFDPESLEVTAVLDWEMAAIGDPLLDLAVFLSYWVDPRDPPALRAMLPSVTTLPGFPGRDEVQAAYARRSGRDLSELPWYLTFAYFKLAVILQQIYARWVRGQTRDERFAAFGGAVRTLIAHAHGRVPGSGQERGPDREVR